MFLIVIYSYESSLQVFCRRDIASNIAEIEVCFLSEESTPLPLWQLTLTKKSVVYPQQKIDRDDSGTMTEEKLRILAQKALSNISQTVLDSVDAERFLSGALRESKPFGDGQLVAVLENSPQHMKLQIFNGEIALASLELSFDEFTTAMPRAEMTDRWRVDVDLSNQ